MGIPKNTEISGSSRKSSLGAAEKVYSARAKYRESKVGGGGGSSRTKYEKIRRFAPKIGFFFRRIPRVRKKSVDSAINHFSSVD